MNITEGNNFDETIRSAIGNPDIEGFYRTSDGILMLDLRLTMEAVARRGLLPRSADLNLIGPAILQVPDYLAEEIDK